MHSMLCPEKRSLPGAQHYIFVPTSITYDFGGYFYTLNKNHHLIEHHYNQATGIL